MLLPAHAPSLDRLHHLVVEALALSDALGCDEIGVALDMARVSAEARLGETAALDAEEALSSAARAPAADRSPSRRTP